MSRNGGYHEEDSDEDQVLYLDYHQAGEESIVAASRASVKDKKLPKYKPLFQHKKYKGDLEEVKYDVDSSPGFAWPAEQPGKGRVEKDPSQQDEFGFGNFASKAHDRGDLSSTFHDEIDPGDFNSSSLPAHTVSQKAASTGRFGVQSSAFGAHIPASGNTSTGVQASRTGTVQGAHSQIGSSNNSKSRDVADDRPAHWNTRRPAAPRTSRADNSNSSKSTVAKSSAGLVNKPKVVQIAKAKPLPTQAVVPALDSVKLSFKPSWMVSATSASSKPHQPTSQIHTLGRAAASELATEDIQEDVASPARSTTAAGAAAVTGSTGQLNTFGSPVAGPQRSLTMHSGGGWGSPSGDYGGLTAGHTGTSGACTSGGASSAHFTSSGSRSSAKAKPGTLKAKLQKLFRDLDAAENRIINVPVDNKSRAVDLQDPRHRAVRYVDAEVTQVLSDKTPFKVIQLCVTNTWQRSSEAAHVTQATGSAAQAGNQPNIGELIVAYFKPDTCVGATRTPGEGMTMRVYDPNFLRRTQGSSAGDTTVFGDDPSVMCAMINTNCWEAIGDDTA